jgi:hypothetical protein
MHCASKLLSTDLPPGGYADDWIRGRLDRSAWWSAHLRRLSHVDNDHAIADAQCSPADREPATQHDLVTAGACGAQSATLDLADHEQDHPETALANDRGIRVSTVKTRWAARPRPGLPDAQQWSTTLALAIIRPMLGSGRLHLPFSPRRLSARVLLSTLAPSCQCLLLIRRGTGGRRPEPHRDHRKGRADHRLRDLGVLYLDPQVFADNWSGSAITARCSMAAGHCLHASTC